MADLSLPAEADVISMPLGPWFPGLNTYEAEFTGKRSYTYASPGSWRGTITLGVTDRLSEDLGARINGLVAQMRGGGKTIALPMPGPTIDDPAVATTVQSISTAGVLTLNRDLAVTEGYWIKIGMRIYVVGTQPAANQLAVEPIGAATVGERVRNADLMEARLASDSPVTAPRNADFWGEWVLPFIEAV